MDINVSDYELIFDNVLIKPDPPPLPAPGELYNGEAKQSNTGTVVKIGMGIQAPDTGVWVGMQVLVGDRVLFDRFSAVPFMESEYLLLEQGYIKSKIK